MRRANSTYKKKGKERKLRKVKARAKAKRRKDRPPKGERVAERQAAAKVALTEQLALTMASIEKMALKLAVEKPDRSPIGCIQDALTKHNPGRSGKGIQAFRLAEQLMNRQEGRSPIITEIKKSRAKRETLRKSRVPFNKILNNARIKDKRVRLFAAQIRKDLLKNIKMKRVPLVGDIIGHISIEGGNRKFDIRDVNAVARLFVEEMRTEEGEIKWVWKSEYAIRMPQRKPEQILPSGKPKGKNLTAAQKRQRARGKKPEY